MKKLFLVTLAIMASTVFVSAQSINIVGATYAADLNENQEPVDPKWTFFPGEKICLSIQIIGESYSGKIAAGFFYGSQLITTTEVDISPLPVDGKAHNVGFSLTQSKPFPVSDNFYTVLYHNGDYIGTYYYSIVPPEDAIPSLVKGLSFSKGVDDKYRPVGRTGKFRSEDTVYLVCYGDFGNKTAVLVDWKINGQSVDEAMTSFTLQENAPDEYISFYYKPEDGWPKGEHGATVRMNGDLIASLSFVVE